MSARRVTSQSCLTISPSSLPVKHPSATSSRLAIPIVDMAFGRQHIDHFMEAAGHHADLPTVFMQRVDKIQRTLGESQLVMHRVEHGDRPGPSNRATRARSASQNSSSPRMARAVTPAISSPQPATTPNSSITSSSMSVESTSITSRPGSAQRRHRNRRTSRAPNFALGGLVNKMHIFLRHASDSWKTLGQCPL